MKRVYRLLTELSSRKALSELTGRFAKSKVSKGFIPHFVKTYGIKVEEAEKELRDYPTLNAFFTRRLKAGMRQVDLQVDTLISPVDALITGVGQVEQGTILNVKGQTYTLQEMLEDEEKERVFANGHYLVLYLSPTDYHRIHVPITGEILKHVHIPGKVYPVNDFGLRYMKRVLSRNERLITYIKNEYTEVAVVKVGALNVSSIQLCEQLLTTRVHKGDELAYFEFGSTVVLLIKEHTFTLSDHIEEGTTVKMGEVLGKLIRCLES